MFPDDTEDKYGFYFENIKTGKAYRFAFQEID